MDFNKFTIKAQEAIQQAQQIALGNGQQAIETGHILKGMIEVDQDVIPFLFKELQVNDKIVLAALNRIVDGYPKVSGGQAYLSNPAQRVLNYALNEMKHFGDEYVSVEIMLYSMLDATDSTGS